MNAVLLLVLMPVLIIGVVTLLTLLPSASRAPRYRPGQPWEHDPVWWTTDPRGLSTSATGRVDDEDAVHAAGGARGTW